MMAARLILSFPHLQNAITSGAKRDVYTRLLPLRNLMKETKSLRSRWKANFKPVPFNTTRILQASGLCVGLSGTFMSCIRKAQCEPKTRKDRLYTGEGGENAQDLPFPWAAFWCYIWHDIWYLLAAIISAFAVAMVNIQIPLTLGEVVDVVSKYTQETAGNFASDIKGPALKLIQMYGLQSCLTFVYISLLSVVGERFSARLRKSLFHSIITQDIAFFDTHKTGEIVDRLTSDVQEFKSSFKLCISQGLRSTTQTIGCVVSLFLISPTMTVAMVVTVPVIIGSGAVIGSLLRKMSRDAQEQVSKATSVADEAVGNVRTVRAFAMEDKEMQLYNREVDEAARLNTKLGYGIGVFQALSNFALNGIVLGTLYIGGTMLEGQQVKAGDLMSFMVATQTIQRSLAQMSLLFGTMVRGMSAGSRVFEYLHLPEGMPMKGGLIIPHHSMKGCVNFQDVGFTYPSRPNQKILKDFNLNVKEGSMVALVGSSGGGKSTVAGLLERFYDVTEGAITIDGRNIKDVDPTWLRGHAIGYINQEPVLFATSVRENIRYGRPDATDTEVSEAAAMANADEFIRGFPEGYDTVLGERGVTVSGGQKQRIAIARALIKNPAILILDEATSALDSESERVVQEALDNVVRGRTVLVIAHRLSTIKNADLIAVMSKGEIVERGTHHELKAKKGLYWHLIKEQEQEEKTHPVETEKKKSRWFGSSNA